MADRKLPPPSISAALLARLDDEPGAVVPDEELIRAGWPGMGTSSKNLRAHIYYLRRQIGQGRIMRVPATVGTRAGFMLVPGTFAAERVGTTPIQTALLRRLEQERGAVVPCAELIRAGWPETGATRSRLADQISRVRRVTPGARILGIREGGKLTGYVLTSSRADDEVSKQGLSQIETALLQRLERDRGGVVPDDELISAGWSDAGTTPGNLRGHIHRLRKRVGPSRIERVRTTGNRPGYMLVRGTRPAKVGRPKPKPSPIQAALLRRLAQEPGAVVADEELIRAGWPATGTTSASLASRVAGLRRVLDGGRIERIRRRGAMPGGYVLVGYEPEVEDGGVVDEAVVRGEFDRSDPLFRQRLLVGQAVTAQPASGVIELVQAAEADSRELTRLSPSLLCYDAGRLVLVFTTAKPNRYLLLAAGERARSIDIASRRLETGEPETLRPRTAVWGAFRWKPYASAVISIHQEWREGKLQIQPHNNREPGGTAKGLIVLPLPAEQLLVLTGPATGPGRDPAIEAAQEVAGLAGYMHSYRRT